jgi:hypothetical protein
MHVGNRRNLRILRVPFHNRVLQSRDLIGWQRTLREIQRSRLQALIGRTQGRRTFSESLAAARIIDDHAAQACQYDKIDGIDNRTWTAGVRIRRRGLRQQPVLGSESIRCIVGGGLELPDRHDDRSHVFIRKPLILDLQDLQRLRSLAA